MIDWVIESSETAGSDPVVIVAAPDTRDAYAGLRVAVQEQPLGTATPSPPLAARSRASPAGFWSSTRRRRCDRRASLELIAEHEAQGATATILSFVSRDLPYGRIVRDADGSVEAIVEDRDATAEQKAIRG